MSLAQNVILISCGSFNPITYKHLRMFEIARDHLQSLDKRMNVVKGYLSPVSDKYGKKELALSTHRIEMVKMAISTSKWLDVLTWECEQQEWTPTAKVLEHYFTSLNCANNNTKLMLLCGADVLQSFSVEGLWKKEDLISIIQNHGLVVISRPEFQPHKYVQSFELLRTLNDHIHVVQEWNQNDISSTKIRRAIQKGSSIKYLVADLVIDYIMENKLYHEKPDDSETLLAPYLMHEK